MYKTTIYISLTYTYIGTPMGVPSSRSAGASLLSSMAHSLSAPLLNLRLVSGCYLSPPSHTVRLEGTKGVPRNGGHE